MSEQPTVITPETAEQVLRIAMRAAEVVVDALTEAFKGLAEAVTATMDVIWPIFGPAVIIRAAIESYDISEVDIRSVDLPTSTVRLYNGRRIHIAPPATRGAGDDARRA